ncbi:MAG: histidine phosphatase family protein [Metallibacterium sp.]
MELILVRGGGAEATLGTLRGQAPLSLGSTGFAALERLAASWIGPPPQLLYCSDLRRALQGAQIFAARFALEPLPDARLRELDLGQWNGVNFATASLRQPVAWQQWNADWVGSAPPGGECWLDLARRVRGWLSGLAAHADDERRVLVISHENPLRALLAEVLELPPATTRRLRIEPAHASALRLAGGTFEVSYLNSPQFLLL